MDIKKNMYFQRSNGEYILLLENCTEEEGLVAAQKFMDEHNFTCYYIRTWKIPGGNKIYDVGSHVEFFVYGFIDV